MSWVLELLRLYWLLQWIELETVFALKLNLLWLLTIWKEIPSLYSCRCSLGVLSYLLCVRCFLRARRPYTSVMSLITLHIWAQTWTRNSSWQDGSEANKIYLFIYNKFLAASRVHLLRPSSPSSFLSPPLPFSLPQESQSTRWAPISGLMAARCSWEAELSALFWFSSLEAIP